MDSSAYAVYPSIYTRWARAKTYDPSWKGCCLGPFSICISMNISNVSGMWLFLMSYHPKIWETLWLLRRIVCNALPKTLNVEKLHCDGIPKLLSLTSLRDALVYPIAFEMWSWMKSNLQWPIASSSSPNSIKFGRCWYGPNSRLQLVPNTTG